MHHESNDHELFTNVASYDFLKFSFGGKNYETDLVETVGKTGQLTSVKCFLRQLPSSGQDVIWIEHNFAFFGGSLGSAEGEKIVRCFKLAEEKRIPIILKCISGGARMQEGTLSLMQMAKVSCAVARYKEKTNLPFISFIADPCFGGVSASYAMQGDVRIAEARSRLGFSGPGIILNTQFQMDQALYDQNCPKEFQSAEAGYSNGQVDIVVPKEKVIDECDRIIGILMAQRNYQQSVPPPVPRSASSSSGEKNYLNARNLTRFDADDIVAQCFDSFIPFGGDGKVAVDFCIRAGVALLRGNPVVLIKCSKGHSVSERKASNFSMPTPAGYRTALRFFEFAERFQLPVVSLIDVVGAHPAFESEIAGQSEAIATNLVKMAGLRVPIVALVVSEGGSGGALALGMGDRIGIMENAYYGVITPEGASSILGRYKDDEQKKKQFPLDCQAIAKTQKIYSHFLLELGVVDEIVTESEDNYKNFPKTAEEITNFFARSLSAIYEEEDVEALVEKRQDKFLKMGNWLDLSDEERTERLEECAAATQRNGGRPPRPAPGAPHPSIKYLAEISVNGHHSFFRGMAPKVDRGHVKIKNIERTNFSKNAKSILDEEGPVAMAKWVREQNRVLLTDTTMRDAHQSLLATRVRTVDLLNAAPTVSALMHEFFSLECWGGATFDVAYRFLNEDPWERLRQLREKIPNVCFQMLLRGANAVGYTSYPDSVVRDFVLLAAKNGMDVFRIFDCFNDLEQMSVAIDAVVEANKVAEVAICFSGDFLNPEEQIYTLDYYYDLAKKIAHTKAHMVAIKDMAGLLKPKHATLLVNTLREALGPDMPLHFHTHNTSSAQLATLHAMANAGVDVVDACMASMADTTSQPSLNAFVATMETYPRDPQIPWRSLEVLDAYWLRLRSLYSIYESGMLAGSASVYEHQIPGGQYSNLFMQCKSLGIMDKWEYALTMYHEVNLFMGDIIKVTPSSKVVGDVALMLVAQDVTPDMLHNNPESIKWPVSAVELAMGMLGKPHHGWPEKMMKAILGDNKKPLTSRPGDHLEPIDLEVIKTEKKLESLEDAISSILYPKVYADYRKNISNHGPLWELPTTAYLYGFHSIGDKVTIDGIEIVLKRFGPLDYENRRKLVFSMNGKETSILISENTFQRKVVYATEENHVGSPVPGVVTKVLCAVGDRAEAGQDLFVITAMKMEVVISAPKDGTISEISCVINEQVEENELITILGA